MPILKDVRKTTSISLPSLPDSKIEVYESFSFDQMMELQKIQGKENLKDDDPRWGLYITFYLIKDWNLTDENENKIPIDSDAFKLMDERDGVFLVKRIGEIYAESHKEVNEKKNKSLKT